MDSGGERALVTPVAKLVSIALLVLGAVIVLRPFLVAGLFAAVFVLATWPVYRSLRHRLKGSDTWAAGVAIALAVVLVLLPFAWLVETAIERVPGWVAIVQRWLVDGPPAPPGWLAKIPLVGAHAEQYWRELAAEPAALQRLGRRLIELARDPMVAIGSLIAQGVLQLVLAMFVAFFFYRDGETIVASLHAGLARIAGALSGELLAIVQDTVRGVVLGIVGTALAQGLLAAIGFAIAGVPGPLLLGGLTALVSIVPGGPVLVWLGATFWLLAQEQPGWALFMVAWGALLVSSIDNVLRPLLISRGASLSFALVFVGVVGGLLAFGFVGIFIGPTLLALAWRLWNTWLEHAPQRG